jgi:hypothetical protein
MIPEAERPELDEGEKRIIGHAGVDRARSRSPKSAA